MKIGSVIAAYRRDQGIGVRALAKEIGTSAATLNRIERGYGYDAAQLALIVLWLLGEARLRKRPDRVNPATMRLQNGKKVDADRKGNISRES
jgi:transcriptional regulator with XRE-family HTH domain